ncbi:hypothetical protein [Roseateles sp.]|nr:hypothetical protein [Roseateles sp.]
MASTPAVAGRQLIGARLIHAGWPCRPPPLTTQPASRALPGA